MLFHTQAHGLISDLPVYFQLVKRQQFHSTVPAEKQRRRKPALFGGIRFVAKWF
jgi:hypothetical protein